MSQRSYSEWDEKASLIYKINLYVIHSSPFKNSLKHCVYYFKSFILHHV